MTLSALASFDDLRRCIHVLTEGVAEEEFLRFLGMVEEYQAKCSGFAAEIARLQSELDKSLVKMGDLEGKLFHARRIIDMESKARRQAEYERDSIESKIVAVADLLRHERNLNNETRDKLAFLHTLPSRKRKSLNTLHEDKSHGDINSTGSLLSDLSITQSEDDFLDMHRSRSWREHRPSVPKTEGPCVGNKRSRLSNSGTPTVPSRRSINSNTVGVDHHTLDVAGTQGAERFCATTKVTIPQDGQGIIRAESKIESLPPTTKQTEHLADGQVSTPRRSAFKEATATPLTPIHNVIIGSPAQHRPLMRKHTFNQKTFLRGDNCVQCQKRIRFGALGLRCRDCPVRCHIDCRPLLTVSCVPQTGTPTAKAMVGYLSDYAPSISPMIPALIVHCVNEIEARGLSEVGLYRLSSSEREYKALKEQFLRGKATPHLGNTDVYVLCCCVKDFLRSLREPLIPTSQWKDFANAVQNPDSKIAEQALYKSVGELPQPNRDTLAFLILHFQRIADCPVVLMPIDNISMIFGPTIVGYSSTDPDQHAIYTEVFTQKQVMKSLLQLPSSFWQQFMELEPLQGFSPRKHSKRVTSENKDLFPVYATPLKGTMKKRKFYGYGTPPPSAKK